MPRRAARLFEAMRCLAPWKTGAHNGVLSVPALFPSRTAAREAGVAAYDGKRASRQRLGERSPGVFRLANAHGRESVPTEDPDARGGVLDRWLEPAEATHTIEKFLVRDGSTGRFHELNQIAHARQDAGAKKKAAVMHATEMNLPVVMRTPSFSLDLPESGSFRFLAIVIGDTCCAGPADALRLCLGLRRNTSRQCRTPSASRRRQHRGIPS